MEQHVAQRTAAWLGIISDLLQVPMATFPVDALSRILASSFDVTGVSWNWRTADGAFGIVVTPESLRHQGECWDQWESGELFDIHPLVQWHRVTRDARPQSTSRVPERMVASEDRHHLTEMLRTVGCEEQLSIACRCHGIQHESFVLARPPPDFSDDDLAVARNIQPAITAVHHQIDLFGRLGLGCDQPVRDLGLTGRELVVLGLLADGHSARGIARRLDSAPRTIEKHLEHIYRKIDVHDRLNAVRVAQDLGLVRGPQAPS
jgi:DNA-binding CsgD family transcriptional regulator